MLFYNFRYIFFFQVPYLSEFFCEMNDMAALENSLIKKPNGLLISSMTESDLEAYKYAFSKSEYVIKTGYHSSVRDR